MEVRVRERLVGALVLVAVVVLLVPAILKGRAPQPPAAPESAPVRRIEMPIGDQAPAPEEQVLVPEPLMEETEPAPPGAAVVTGAAWAVQLGAFSNKAKAEQLVAELRKRQFSAFVLEYRASGKVLYRVRVGPEQDRGRAEATAARLAKEGFQPVVARHP